MGFKSFKFFHSYKSLNWLSSITKKGKIESAFASYVGFGVLMTSKLGNNVILIRYVVAISPMKDSELIKMKWYPSILKVIKADELKALSKDFIFCFEARIRCTIKRDASLCGLRKIECSSINLKSKERDILALHEHLDCFWDF